VKAREEYIVPIIEHLEKLGCRISKEQADNFADYVYGAVKEGIDRELKRGVKYGKY